MRSVSLWVQALQDFRDRICKYEEVYETITDRNLHYIKLIDMWGPHSLALLISDVDAYESLLSGRLTPCAMPWMSPYWAAEDGAMSGVG